MRFYFILVRIATTKKITTTKHVRDVRKEKSLYTADGNATWCSHYGNQYRDSSNKPENRITTPLSHTSRNLHQHVCLRDTCASMFMFMLLEIPKICNQPRPSKRCIKKMWEKCTMEFCSFVIKSETITFTSKWIELEITMLREISS